MNAPQIIDANLNRLSEGLRVIEEYTRFITKEKEITKQLSQLRKQINLSEDNPVQNLLIRNTKGDMRAKETPTKRGTWHDLLKANFKRAEEACRVLEEVTGNHIYNHCRYDLYDLEKEILLGLLQKHISSGIYLISDEVSVLEKGLKDGASIIQLRDKYADKPTILEKALALKTIAKKYDTPVIINDFIDIAITVDADGLHTGQDDIPLPYLRDILGPHKILGRTTHNITQGLKAQKEGADYVSVGPIWDTPSKPGRPGIGFSYLKKAQEKLSIPYVAIGGVSLENIDNIIPYKPTMIGLIRDHDNLKKMLKKMDC